MTPEERLAEDIRKVDIYLSGLKTEIKELRFWDAKGMCIFIREKAEELEEQVTTLLQNQNLERRQQK